MHYIFFVFLETISTGSNMAKNGGLNEYIIKRFTYG